MQDVFALREEEDEEQPSRGVLAVVIGYTEATAGSTKTYNTLLMTVDRETQREQEGEQDGQEAQEDIRVAVIEAKGKGDSRLTEKAPERLHMIGTVLELTKVDGQVVDKKGVVFEVEREHDVDDEMIAREHGEAPAERDTRKADKRTKKLRYAATTEEVLMLDRAVQMLARKTGTRRKNRLRFRTEDPVEWMTRPDIESRSLTERAVAMTNTYQPGDLGVAASLVALMGRAAGESPEVIAILAPHSEEVVGALFAVDGMPIYRSVGWAPDRRREATVGEKRLGTMVVIDQLVKYTPETDRYEGYAVLYNPLTMHVPHILSNGALAVQAGEKRWTRAVDMQQIPHVAGIASVGVTPEEALSALLPVGAWVQLMYAESLDKPIADGGPLVHETKNWAALAFAGTGVAETGQREAFGKFDMLRRIPDRRKIAKEDEIRYRSSSFYDMPGAYRMISVYPHPQLEERIARELFEGRSVSLRERSAALRSALMMSTEPYYRLAKEIPAEEILAEKSTQKAETYLQTIPTLRTDLRMPPQRKVKGSDGTFREAPNAFSEPAAAYTTGSTAALLHEFAYLPHITPYSEVEEAGAGAEEAGRRYSTGWINSDTDELLMVAVVADVKSSERAQQKSASVVYGFIPHTEAYDLTTRPRLPWVMYKPPILLTVPLTRDNRLVPELSVEAGIGGPVIKGLSEDLKMELARLGAFLFTRFGLSRARSDGWKKSYVADFLERYKFKVDATHARRTLLAELGAKLKATIEEKKKAVSALRAAGVEDSTLEKAEKEMAEAETMRDKLYSELRIDPEKGQQRVFIDLDGKLVRDFFEGMHSGNEEHRGYYQAVTESKQHLGPTDLDREWARVTSTIVPEPGTWDAVVERSGAEYGEELRQTWAQWR